MKRAWFARLSSLYLGYLGILALPLGMAACAAGEPDSVEVSMDHFSNDRVAYGLTDPANELRVRRSTTDAQGTTHVRFDQYYKGVPVFEGESITHIQKGGRLASVTDALRRGLSLDARPRLSKKDAEEVALDATQPAERTSITGSVLQILPRGERSKSDRLVWHITVFAESDERGPEQWEHFVDAHTGDLAWSFESLETNASVGSGKTMWSGTQQLNTNSITGSYELRDTTRGGNGGNYTCQMFLGYFGCNVVKSASNVFGNGDRANTDKGTAAADAAFGLQATWSYYKTAFGRNGIDNAGKQTYSRVHYGFNYQNAFWSDQCFCMTYGDGGSMFYSLTSLDVAGHEMSHGVMASEAALTYSGESGGLNESNSDIFGTMVEFTVNSAADPGDWWIGERIFKSNWSTGTFNQAAALRYMDDPHKDGNSPACWSSSTGGLDVHYSSGANNHMFFLLANGGTSKCNGKVVAGIGKAKAAAIWYKAVTDYMTSSTNYKGARTACLQAATALYGASSAEYTAVAAAYAAINVN